MIDQPKMFWISESRGKELTFYTVYKNRESALDPNGPGFHVIEYSAYKQLAERYNALVRDYDRQVLESVKK